MVSDTLAMTAQLALIKEIDGTITSASPDRRSKILGKITDLFVEGANEFAGEDILIFDDVFVRLVAKIEQSARELLAKRLAPIRNSPPQIIRALAFDDTIKVAGPVLIQAVQLDDKTLVEIAKTKGHSHMLAISQRASLNEPVTDALVELGDREVLINIVDNFGASISDTGFSTLVRRSEGDDVLADLVGSRPEIPAPLLGALVAKASLAVRAKLEAAHPEAKAEIRRAVAEAAGRVEARIASPLFDYTAAMATIESLKQSGKLDEGVLASFAKSGAFAEVTAALAIMCDLPLQFVERAMTRDQSENLVVLAKAIGLSSSTVNEILLLRAKRGFLAQREIAQRLARFNRLQSGTAQEIVRLHRAHPQRNPSVPR
jgi:uncharacterized protein (DUF2336 family)